jgi:hypothetical protein
MSGNPILFMEGGSDGCDSLERETRTLMRSSTVTTYVLGCKGSQKPLLETNDTIAAKSIADARPRQAPSNLPPRLALTALVAFVDARKVPPSGPLDWEYVDLFDGVKNGWEFFEESFDMQM